MIRQDTQKLSCLDLSPELDFQFLHFVGLPFGQIPTLARLR